MKKLTVFVLIAFIGISLFTLYANRTIESETKQYITSELDQVKGSITALLLGTSKTLKNGKDNEYFFKRIEATVLLYKNNKLRYIIVSGDNSEADYNEPLDMKNELIKRGIPDSVIYLDYAGFRTFDSVIRANEIFGQDSLLIISQQFHNERAVYIARKNKISAWAYNAEDVSAFNGFKTQLREYFARDKVFIDLFLGIGPKYLGEKITLR